MISAFITDAKERLHRLGAALRAGREPFPGWTHVLFRVGRLLLAGAVMLAAIVGLLFLTRGTAVHRVRSVAVDGSLVAPGDSSFPVAVAVLTGTVLLPGNRVELALNGDGTFSRLYADLRNARESITIQNYYAQPGAVIDSLAEVLVERAQNGVDVYFLYDAFGSAALTGKFFARLRDAGVKAIAFRPLSFENLWVLQNRSHVRGVVIDGRIAWTGDFGLDDKWLGGGLGPNEWRETNVLGGALLLWHIHAPYLFAGTMLLTLALVIAWKVAGGQREARPETPQAVSDVVDA